MGIGTGIVPEEPTVYASYAGFFLGIASSVSIANLTSVEYQVRVSDDNSFFGDWETVTIAFRHTNYNTIDGPTYALTYYQYRCRLYYDDGSTTEWSDFALPGSGGLVLGTPGAIDQLAGSLGTITSGYLRGVVFETSAYYPKVRFDPSGFYAISLTSTPVFINALTGEATFSGNIQSTGLEIVRVHGSSVLSTPNFASLSWHMTDLDGPIMGVIRDYGYFDGLAERNYLENVSLAPRAYAQIVATATPATNQNQSYIGAYAENNGSWIYARAEDRGSSYSQDLTVLDPYGNANYVSTFTGNVTTTATTFVRGIRSGACILTVRISGGNREIFGVWVVTCASTGSVNPAWTQLIYNAYLGAGSITLDTADAGAQWAFNATADEQVKVTVDASGVASYYTIGISPVGASAWIL